MPRPQGAYVTAVAEPLRAADVLITTAGMTPRKDGHLTATGLVGRDLDLQAARRAAALAARNAVAAVTGAMTAKPATTGGTTAAAASDGGVLTAADALQRVRRWVRMTVYGACAEGFTELSAVADGASTALDELTPGLARPARSAIGVRALPGGAPLEVELTAIGHPVPASPSSLDTRRGGLLVEAICMI
jgi:enamine deaminase RidA (YjgF/YER057c/UK114 family)